MNKRKLKTEHIDKKHNPMNTIKYIILGILTLAFTSSYSQTTDAPKTEFTKMYLPVWLEARKHCLQVAETMPADKYHWKPSPDSKTFGEQMVHIAHTIELLTQRYVLGMEVTANTPNANNMSKAEIIKLLETGFDYVTSVIMTVENEKLSETCKMYHSGNIVSREFAFFYVQDHLTNHRAKANLYIRMNGIAPPEYTW